MIYADNIPRFRFRTGAALGGAALATVLIVATPGAGTAQAHGYSTPSGDAVGRPGFGSEESPGNPAPGVRVVQAVGDKIFNQRTALNKALDDSAFGSAYHWAFGTANYDEPTHGSNGTFTGLLNGPIIRDAYDGVQKVGVNLIDEEDLSGRVVRLVSGAAESEHHHDDEEEAGAAATQVLSANSGSKCTVTVAKTTLSAQGSC